MSERHSLTFACYTLFGAMLGMAGLPIYIHAPKYFVDNYGLSLSMLGAILFGLRLIDFLQDPLLGRLAERTVKYGAAPAWIAGCVMSVGMFGLFAVPAPLSPIVWFAVNLTAVFTGFSFLSIRFYALGIAAFGSSGQLNLARWRETGTLLGISFAAVSPTFFTKLSQDPFLIHSFMFFALALVALLAMHSEWKTNYQPFKNETSAYILSDPLVRQMLILAVLNTAPVAVSSTLFLFFVESRLLAPDAAGAFLILFFLAATMSAPLWTSLSHRYGARRILLLSMVGSLFAFAYTFFLTEGQTLIFAVICASSGATLGADLVILPAIFARHLARTNARPEIGFGLWNFASKISLAIAAVLVLPLVELLGFRAGADNSEIGLFALSFGYAALPCILKLFAILWLLQLSLRDKNNEVV